MVKAAKNLKTDSQDDIIEGERMDVTEEEGDNGGPGSDETAFDMLQILQEFQKRKAKQTSTQAAIFQREVKNIFAAARRNVRDLSDAGITLIEEIRAKAKSQLRTEPLDFEKDIEELLKIHKAHDDSVRALMSHHAMVFDNLLPRRVEQIDAASSMMVQDPIDRDCSLKKHLRAAQASLEQAKHEEKRATDAQELIKHVKALMLC